MFFSRALRRIKYGEPIIVVSGVPRSGTSMLMRMLESGGVPLWSDNLRGADDDNPNGYFELERIKTLDKGGDKTWVKDARGKAIKVISFLLKDLPLENFYQVLFVRRQLDEVLASQNKMLAHRGQGADVVSDEKMKQNYESHLRKVEFFLADQRNFAALYLDHRTIIEQPDAQAARIQNFLYRPLDVQAMAQSVNPQLYRNRR